MTSSPRAADDRDQTAQILEQEMGMDLEWEGKTGKAGVSPTWNSLRLGDFQPQVSHMELSSLPGMNYIFMAPKIKRGENVRNFSNGQ